MKESDPLPTLLPTTATKKQQSLTDTGRNRYKLYALTAILLLAAYSLLTATAATLSSSSSSDAPHRRHSDLDILEVEERERFVEQMWELYAHGAHRVRLPRFWREAFEAAYEELAGDDGASRGDAVSEIARMSMAATRFLPDPESSSSRRSDAAVANAAKVKQHQIIGHTKATSSSMALSGTQLHRF